MTATDDKHAALPREVRDLLGSPTGPELTTPDGIGRFRHYQGGSIYFTQETGAHEIHGAIENKWAELGFERSVLGYPTPMKASALMALDGSTIFNADRSTGLGRPAPTRSTGRS
jgi:uncharacterized protein with LGFP repeats